MTINQKAVVSGVTSSESKSINALVLGMGSYAFGKEQRAVSTVKFMSQVSPYFLITKWEDGSVSQLLARNELEFASTSFGYLGRAKPMWTLMKVLEMPKLFAIVIMAYWKRRCSVVIFLNLLSFLNALPSVLFLKYFRGARLVFYLGDTPTDSATYRLLGKMVDMVSNRFI